MFSLSIFKTHIPIGQKEESNIQAFAMEGKWVVVLAVLVLAFQAMGPDMVECAFGIELNPCTTAECVAECKKALKEKYQSAACAMGSQGWFCVCLG